MNHTKEMGKKILGVVLIIIGVFALITPLTPGSWLAVIGLELLGLRYLFQEKIERWFRRRKNKKEPDAEQVTPPKKKHETDN